ncbi:LytR/AlgR family response regulator transcription factor [Butyrivibrio sp. NC2002]|uniref:LytR/AlgR family response regulator transcription factor n=1 Tax=Butyrivibrio sp. NC2002 TaxID=1410610 RepID=UPI00068D6FBF|nr:LytTR family DNA-binding domain-containing protein [Butyrivibrio sp. NC2002]
MISALLYDREEKELKYIDTAFRDAFAKHSEDTLKTSVCCDEEKLKKAVKETEIVDISFLEAVDERGIDIAGKVRKKYPDTAMLLVVSDTMKPTQYIKPSIMASALIMRPLDEADTKETITEFIQSVVKAGENEGDYLYVDTLDGKIRIPFDKIIYIEAREKRIFIRLSREEYGIKETLENILDKLPPRFARIHRSFIVNKDKIKIYNKTSRIAELEGGLSIPVSRSFKQVMDNL